MRLVYGCPADDKPAGGVKVIYRQVELLRRMGIESYIWHPGKPDFRCAWFDNEVQTLDTPELHPQHDLVVLPEIWGGTNTYRVLREAGFRMALYVQNAYMTHASLDPEEPDAMQRNLAHASLVLAISRDTAEYVHEVLQVPRHKIVLQRYSLNFDLFKPANKLKLITYMPRKMGAHAVRVVSALQPLLPPDWHIAAIDGKPEAEVAQMLAHSAIFMSFSDFEGLPVPPVEAAACGNFVIGYHGEGGREYWQEPNFSFIRPGDIRGFVNKVVDIAQGLDRGALRIGELQEGIELIKARFGAEQEQRKLQDFLDRALVLMEEQNNSLGLRFSASLS